MGIILAALLFIGSFLLPIIYILLHFYIIIMKRLKKNYRPLYYLIRAVIIIFVGLFVCTIMLRWYYSVCRDKRIIEKIDRYDCFYLDGKYYSLPMKFHELPQDYSYDSSYGEYSEFIEPGKSYWFSLKKDNLSLNGEFINETDRIIPFYEAVVKKLIIHYERKKEDVIDRNTHRKANRLILYEGINLYTSNSKRYKLLSDEEGYIRLPENYKNRPKYEQYPLDTILEIHLIIDEIDYLYFHYIYSSDEFVVEISSE